MTPGKLTAISQATTQPNAQGNPDAELISYYEGQHKASRSDEWRACIDAILKQLRQIECQLGVRSSREA